MFRLREAGVGWGAAVRIELNDTERSELRARARRRKIARADAMRSEIVLLAADGMTNLAIAERLGTTRVTVATWRRRFAAGRLDGLVDEPRPGAPRKIGDEKIAEVVTTTLETMPAAATRAGDDAGRRDALEHALDGQGHGRVGLDRASHLAGVLAAAAPQRDLQAVHRPAVRGEGPRHRRPLSRPAGSCAGALRR